MIQRVKLVLIRHAKAGSSDHFAGEDFYRPLSKPGERQALAIADLANLAGADAIISSPYLRCIQTVQPLSKRLDIPIVTDPILGDATASRELKIWLDKTVTGAPGFKVVCSHGDVIPVIVGAIFKAAPSIDYPNLCAKGSLWYFEIDQGLISGASYQDLDGFVWKADL